ncbi:MAG: carboxylesterase family protein, partial [Caulobacteraceae bacterium]
AWSACYLMVSPGSVGLFHRVILQSGPCLEPSSLNSVELAAQAGPAFAESLGCSKEAAVACLRAAPARRIARAASTRGGLNGPGSWGPVYGDAVAPLSPPEAFASGRFIRTPTIVGSNADEGRLFAVEVRDLHRYEQETHWMYGADGPRVVARYPVGPEGPGLTMARSFTDQRFACPSNALRRLLARHVEVHGYEFVDPAAPIVVPRWLMPYDMGAYHAAELAYVFGTRWVFADPARFTPKQRALSDRMMRLWAGFGHDPEFNTVWPRTTATGSPIRLLDPEGDRMDDTFFERHDCAFWDATAFGAVAPATP